LLLLGGVTVNTTAVSAERLIAAITATPVDAAFFFVLVGVSGLLCGSQAIVRNSGDRIQVA
jgi:hypothetical protein